MRKVKVIKGKYTDQIGKATNPNKLNLIMFYSIEDINPYHGCLHVEENEWLN